MKRFAVVVATLFLVLLTASVALAQTQDEGFLYVVGNDGGIVITGYTGTVTDMVVPDALEGKPVRAIGPEAFSDNSYLRSIVLPEGLNSIGNSAFKNNFNLESVKLPSSLRTIGESAFSSCSELKRIDLPSEVRAIPRAAFLRCLSLTEVVFPGKLQEIGDYAFAVTGLTSLALPQGLQSIGEYAFYGNLGLTKVTLPNSVQKVDPFAFFVCDNLQEIVLSASMPLLASGVLDKCTKLERVAIPRTVRQVRDDALHMGHDKAPNAAILGVPGSEAERFANRVGYPFKQVGETATVQITINGVVHGSEMIGVDLASNAKSVQLDAITSPETLWPGVAWSSSNDKVASVDQSGLTVGLGRGEATITASAIDGSGAQARVLFNFANLAKSVLIEGPAELPAKGKVILKALVLPENTDNKVVAWTVSDTAVATINNRGQISASNVQKRETVMVSASTTDASGIVGTHELSINPLVTTVVLTMDGQPLDSKEPVLIDLLSENASIQLVASTLPFDATQSVIWKSSAQRVASVSDTGFVTGLRRGKAVITATSTDGTRKSAKVNIEVASLSNAVLIEGAQAVAAGKSITLKATVLPEQSDNKRVVWSSSDESIARVNRSGVVTAKKIQGLSEVIISAEAQDGSGAQDKYVVHVLPEAEEVFILREGSVVDRKEPITFDLANRSKGLQLVASVIPADAGQSVVWKSSDPRVLQVDNNGNITLLKRGTVTLTATASDGSRKRAICTIKVVDSSR